MSYRSMEMMNGENGGMKMKNLKLALIAAPLIALSPFSALAQNFERTWGNGKQGFTQAASGISDFVLKRKPEIKKPTSPSKTKLDYSQTAYAKIDALFNHGSPVSREDMTGAFLGRCYAKDAPNHPYGNLLVGGPVVASGDGNGPLFSDATPAVFQVAVVLYSHFSYSKGNNLGRYPNVDRFLESHINDEAIQSQISRYIQYGNALKDSWAGINHFSKANGYILLKIKSDDDEQEGYRCYFFKKIHD